MYILNTYFGNIGIETNSKGISKIILGIKKSANKITPDSDIKKIILLIEDYFQGKKVKFNIPYDISVLPLFTQSVLKETKKIPYGSTITYSELAQKIGKPKACRAIGQALASNPLPIIIPCHRVIRKDGSLGGFSAGFRWKKLLLDIENKHNKRAK